MDKSSRNVVFLERKWFLYTVADEYNGINYEVVSMKTLGSFTKLNKFIYEINSGIKLFFLEVLP